MLKRIRTILGNLSVLSEIPIRRGTVPATPAGRSDVGPVASTMAPQPCATPPSTAARTPLSAATAMAFEEVPLWMILSSICLDAINDGKIDYQGRRGIVRRMDGHLLELVARYCKELWATPVPGPEDPAIKQVELAEAFSMRDAMARKSAAMPREPLGTP